MDMNLKREVDPQDRGWCPGTRIRKIEFAFSFKKLIGRTAYDVGGFQAENAFALTPARSEELVPLNARRTRLQPKRNEIETLHEVLVFLVVSGTNSFSSHVVR